VDGAVTTRSRWWFPAVALGRVAWLRVIAYAFVWVDVLVTTSWVAHHAAVSADLYQPLLVARVLHLPTPTGSLVDATRVGLLVASAVALAAVLAGRTTLVRGAGVATAVLYAWWMVVAMSYGKVDHDRFAYLVLLAVLPTVGAARLGERRTTEAAGFAVRATQVAVVATYFLAAWAKVRFGGWGWVNGATLTWAVIRRGTWLSDWTLQVPWVLRIVQWAIVVSELASPLIFLVRRERVRVAIVGAMVVFHLVTFAAVGIIFLPHLVALTAFLPLERLGSRTGERARAGRAEAPQFGG
jgi:hypothetical protein